MDKLGDYRLHSAKKILWVSHFDLNWEIETFFWSDSLGPNCLMALISSPLIPSVFCFHLMYTLVRIAMDKCLNWTVYSWNVYVRCFFLNYLPFLNYFNWKCFLEKPVSLHNCICISKKTMVIILTFFFLNIRSSSFIRLWIFLQNQRDLERDRSREGIYLFSYYFVLFQDPNLKKQNRTKKPLQTMRNEEVKFCIYVPLTLAE